MPNPNGGLDSTYLMGILAHFSAHCQSDFAPKTKDRFPVALWDAADLRHFLIRGADHATKQRNFLV